MLRKINFIGLVEYTRGLNDVYINLNNGKSYWVTLNEIECIVDGLDYKIGQIFK